MECPKAMPTVPFPPQPWQRERNKRKKYHLIPGGCRKDVAEKDKYIYLERFCFSSIEKSWIQMTFKSHTNLNLIFISDNLHTCKERYRRISSEIRVLALYTASSDLIINTACGSLSLTRNDLWAQEQEKMLSTSVCDHQTRIHLILCSIILALRFSIEI